LIAPEDQCHEVSVWLSFAGSISRYPGNAPKATDLRLELIQLMFGFVDWLQKNDSLSFLNFLNGFPFP
jgi:hypothetical protein